MVTWKKLTPVDLETILPEQIYKAPVATEAEAEAQEVTRCPECGAMLFVTDSPQYVNCTVCNEVFRTFWY